MKTETKSFAEYKAPGCKVVEVHVEKLVCTSFGNEGEAGGDGTFDEESC